MRRKAKREASFRGADKGVCPAARSKGRRERGGIFLISVVVLAGLVAVVAGAAVTQRVAIRAQINRSEARLASVYAEAGIQRALASIQLQAEAPGLTSTLDDWGVLGDQGSTRFVVGRGSFRLEILDASSRVNINVTELEQLERLPLTPEQIDSLLDWREDGLQPRIQGAKDEYYNSLANPYNAKLRPFDSVEELLLVRGFTPATLYEPPEDFTSSFSLTQGPADQQPPLIDLVTASSFSLNVSPLGQTKLNVNTASVGAMTGRGIRQPLAQAIVQRRNNQGTFVRIGEVLSVAGVTTPDAVTLLDNLTVATGPVRRGLINIQTASEAVLNSIPELSYDLSAGIVASQAAGGFGSVGDLLTVPGFTMQLLQETADLFTVNSQAFIVRSIGTSGRMSVAMEATVVIEDGVARIINQRRLNLPAQWARWNWPEETTADITYE